MAYNEQLAQRVRQLLIDQTGYEEKKMFGGIGFLLHGNMACGIVKDELVVRVGTDRYQASLAMPHTREFDITGRTMKGWIMVAANGNKADEDLSFWVNRGVAFAATLPPK